MGDDLITTIDVSVYENDEIIVSGQTKVMLTEDNLMDSEGNVIYESIEAAAKAYAENVFLNDLRNNIRTLKDLVLPCDG